MPIPNRRTDTVEGVIRTAVLYRPDEQVDPEAYRAATLLERYKQVGVWCGRSSCSRCWLRSS